jgi:hypothetical protein
LPESVAPGEIGVRLGWRCAISSVLWTGSNPSLTIRWLTLFSPKDYGAAFRAAGLVAEAVESPMEGRDLYIGVSAP